MINFGRGAPSPDLIDGAGLALAARAALAVDAGAVLGYGSPAGHPPLRKWLADRHGVDVDCVMVTPGGMQAVVLALGVLARGEVLLDRPTYDVTLRAVAARGLPVRQQPLDEEWPAPDAASGRRCVYTVPTFRNPDGVTMPLPGRERLLKRAAGEDALVIEDDPYRALRFTGPVPPPLWRLGGLERVVHVSSLSKTVCPGLRVGYVISDRRHIESLAAAANRTYIAPGVFTQAVAHQYLVRGGLEAPLRNLREALAVRAGTMCDLLRELLPEAGLDRPRGGYFLWLRLPAPLSSPALAETARRHGVRVAPGTAFQLDGGEDAVRLCFAAEPPDRIEAGVRRLVAAVEETAGPNRSHP